MRNPKILKKIDAVLGPLLLKAHGAFWKKRSAPKTIQAIALLKIAAIGDTVLVSALLTDLKAAFPNARITLFVGSSNYAYAKLLSHVDQVELLEFKKPFSFLWKLLKTKFDLFIDSDSWPRVSALTAALSRSRFTIGFETQGQNRHYGYDKTVKHSNEIHELENYRNLLRAINIKAEAPPQAVRTWSPQKDLVLFHLWPGGKQSHLKEWDFKHWTELASRLPHKIALTGAPSDFNRNEEFLKQLPPDLKLRVENKAGLSIAETADLLASANLLISVNTGIMHMAAAIGTPTVGLHGPTNPKRWGPIGPRTRAILSHTPGAGSLNLGFEYPDDINRMEGLSIDEVVEATKELFPTSQLKGDMTT